MKTRIITLLIAITAIIGSAEAQTKINIHQGGEVVYTLPIIEMDSIGFQKQAEVNQHNGHEFVDLGLPTGLKWATCNVGATTPEAGGNVYAWGETTPQEWLSTEYTYNDNPAVLPLSADAANVNWGGKWRMPTYEETDELRENCTWTWTTQNGVKGYKVTSKINGNSIFLPAAGSIGSYWLSSLSPYFSNDAWYMSFDSVNVGRGAGYRSKGLSVRAVCE